MHDIDLVRILQIFSALVLGGVVGLFVSQMVFKGQLLVRAKLPATVLITLAFMVFSIFPIW